MKALNVLLAMNAFAFLFSAQAQEFDEIANAANMVLVETTHDACDKSHVVKLFGKDGVRAIKASDLDAFDLPAVTSETRWYCGGTRERFASGRPYNYVEVQRAENGAITWNLYMKN